MKNHECSNCGCPVIGNRYLHESVCKYRFSPSDSFDFAISEVEGRMMQLDSANSRVEYTLDYVPLIDCDNIPRLR